MLNTTNEILLPTNIVAIKLDGSLVKPEIILDIKDPVFLSISNFNQSKIELKHNKTYKKSKYKNKHIVRKKPIKPREILLRPNKIRKNYLWIN